MDEDKQWEIKQWLTKAEHDLRSARCLFGANPPLVDTAVYHCQQAAEKAVKAFLATKDCSLQKTHLLLPLVEQCMEYDDTFSALRDAAEILTPYSTAFRYPGDVIEPMLEDVEEAIELARHVFDFVLVRLSNAGVEKSC